MLTYADVHQAALEAGGRCEGSKASEQRDVLKLHDPPVVYRFPNLAHGTAFTLDPQVRQYLYFCTCTATARKLSTRLPLATCSAP